MSIVYVPGVWDLLHVGHISMLTKASKLGNILVVGVPSDEMVIQDKQSPPIIPLLDRLLMLNSLACVDFAIPYHSLEFLTHLNMIRPDVLAVGETWGKEDRHTQAEEWLITNCCKLVKIPYYREESTTQIKQRVLKEWSSDE